MHQALPRPCAPHLSSPHSPDEGTEAPRVHSALVLDLDCVHRYLDRTLKTGKRKHWQREGKKTQNT